MLNAIERGELARYLKRYDFSDRIREKTFLVTGSKGMTGEGLIKWLLAENRENGAGCSIIASTRCPEKRPGYIEDSDPVEFCAFGSEREFVRDRAVDYVISGAAPTGRDFFMSKPLETISVIIGGTEAMLEIARERSASLVLLSSVEAYGIVSQGTVLEESYVGPIGRFDVRNAYPLGKCAAEFLCFAASKEHGTDAKIVRPSSIHGLFQRYDEGSIFNEVLRCVLEHRNLVMRSDGLTKKPFIYTLDAVAGILAVLFNGTRGEAYNLANPHTYMTMNELASNVFEEFAPDLQIVHEPALGGGGYLPHQDYSMAIEKAGALGWDPLTDLASIYRNDIERFAHGDGARAN